MTRCHRRAAALTAATLSALAACGCGRRTYGRGLRRVAPFGVRAGWVDSRNFDLAEVGDRPLAGVYFRPSVDGKAIVEIGADAVLDTEAADERQLYAGGVSVLFFPARYGAVYLHAGGGAMSETTRANDYLDGYISVGAGYSLPAGPTRLDLRGTVWQMIDSANADRAVVLTAGYGF
jgi:hypothetical protein